MNRARLLFPATSDLFLVSGALNPHTHGVRALLFRMGRCRLAIFVPAVIFAVLSAPSCLAAVPGSNVPLAPRPPMGWNDWAHCQCGHTAQTILANARALVRTGLSARRYNIVTVGPTQFVQTRRSDNITNFATLPPDLFWMHAAPLFIRD